MNNEFHLRWPLFSEAIVYKFDNNDISDGNLITPDELRRNKHIFDAELIEEYWIINQEIAPRKSYLIQLMNSNYENITENFSKEERELNIIKNNNFDLSFTVTKFENFNYKLLDIEKYKKEIKDIYYPYVLEAISVFWVLHI
jgi:hypothetical protein